MELCQWAFTELFREIGETAVVNTTPKVAGAAFLRNGSGTGDSGSDEKSKVENEISDLLQNIERVRCLMVDSQDALWIATTGMGIYQVSAANGTYRIRNFSEERWYAWYAFPKYL